jgi:propionyl-CoA carboxylase beta subunit
VAQPDDTRPGDHSSADLARRVERAQAGNVARVGEKLAAQNKLFVRDRLALLLDKGSFVEDALLANNQAEDLPADGVVTGVGRIEGRPVCVMANDPTVKAGSWGARTVEKIVRLTEYALRHELPVFWLVDSAGARCDCRERCPRSAACSDRRPQAAPTSPASATWCSWSRATPPCTSARPAWPRW